MRKLIILPSLMLALASCRTHEAGEVAQNTQQLASLKSFNGALLKVLKAPEQEPVEKTGIAELSNYKKRLLLPAAIELIETTGVSRERVQRKTQGDIEEILRWAVQIHRNRGKAVEYKPKKISETYKN